MSAATATIGIRRLARSPATRDLAVAAAAFAATLGLLAGARGSSRSLDALGGALAALACFPLLARRRSPLGVFALTAAASAALNGLDYALGPPFGPTIALFFVAGDEQTRGRIRATAAVVLGLFAVHVGATALAHHDFPTSPILFGVVVWGGAWLIGDQLRQRRERLAELVERGRRAEQERNATAAWQPPRSARASPATCTTRPPRDQRHPRPGRGRQALQERDSRGGADGPDHDRGRRPRDDRRDRPARPRTARGRRRAEERARRSSRRPAWPRSRRSWSGIVQPASQVTSTSRANDGRFRRGRPGRLPDPAGGPHQRRPHGSGSADVEIAFGTPAARVGRREPVRPGRTPARARRARHPRHARAGRAARRQPRRGRAATVASAFAPASRSRRRSSSERGARPCPARRRRRPDARRPARQSSPPTPASRSSARRETGAPRSPRPARSAPIVVLMDVRMPDLDGISATREAAGRVARGEGGDPDHLRAGRLHLRRAQRRRLRLPAQAHQSRGPARRDPHGRRRRFAPLPLGHTGRDRSHGPPADAGPRRATRPARRADAARARGASS